MSFPCLSALNRLTTHVLHQQRSSTTVVAGVLQCVLQCVLQRVSQCVLHVLYQQRSSTTVVAGVLRCLLQCVMQCILHVLHYHRLCSVCCNVWCSAPTAQINHCSCSCVAGFVGGCVTRIRHVPQERMPMKADAGLFGSMRYKCMMQCTNSASHSLQLQVYCRVCCRVCLQGVV